MFMIVNQSITRRCLSFLLSAAVAVSSFGMPVVTANATTGVRKPVKEDDANYNPVFSFASHDQAFYDDLRSDVEAEVPDIGCIPNMEEFVSLTNYSSGRLSLTEFREKYHTGIAFIRPVDIIDIYLTNESELELLSSLVNNTAEDETSVEQQYYASAYYKLGCMLDMAGRAVWQPIGTDAYPFTGIFDGDGFEISGLKIEEENGDTYSTGAFGLFGYNNGIIRNLGITKMNISVRYTVAADIAFICARNMADGIIEDCYVNGKTTSKINASNATAGGICAENWGYIQRCYADAFAKVDTTPQAFSEPQPIVTLNHDDGHIDTASCYYIKWADMKICQGVENRTWPRDISEDDGTEKAVVGWVYTGDESRLNGTGLSLQEFVDDKMSVNTNFYGAKLGNEVFQYYHYRTGIRLSDGMKLYGTGEYFDLAYAKSVTYDSNRNMGLYIFDEQDWRNLVDIINRTDSSITDEEWEFYSTNTYDICPFDSSGMYNTTSNAEHILNIPADIPPLGTDAYPFKGKLTGGVYTYYNRPSLLINIELDTASGIQSPLIGVLDTTASISEYISFSVSGHLDINQYLDAGYKGIVIDKNHGSLSCLFFDHTRAYGHGDGRCIKIRTDDPYYINHTDEMMSKDFFGIGAVGEWAEGGYMCVRNALGYEICDADNDETCIFTAYFPVYKELTGAGTYSLYGFTTKRLTGYTTGVKYVSNSTETDYLSFTYIEKYKYSSRVYRPYGPTFNKYVDIYPTMMCPDIDEDGYRKISKPCHFLWLQTYAQGDKAKLVNTIDVSMLSFRGINREGYYTLTGDRPASDTEDISNFIDINAVKDCYCIIGLRIYDGMLTKRAYKNTSNSNYYIRHSDGSITANSNQTGRVSWSNIYLIGGEVTITSALPRITNYIATEWYNVHTSMKISCSIGDNTVGCEYGLSVSSYDPCYSASYCSNHSDISVSGGYYGRGGMTGIGRICDHCVGYGVIKNWAAKYAMWSDVGVQATYCRCGMTTDQTSSESSPVATGNEIYGIAMNCYYCIADKTYDMDGKVPFDVFGSTADHCVFSGKLYCRTRRETSKFIGMAQEGMSDSYLASDGLIQGWFSHCGALGRAGRNLIASKFILNNYIQRGSSYIGYEHQGVCYGNYNTIISDIIYRVYDTYVSTYTGSYYENYSLGMDLSGGNIHCLGYSVIDGNFNRFNGTVDFQMSDGTPMHNVFIEGTATGDSNTFNGWILMSGDANINYRDIDFGNIGVFSAVCIISAGGGSNGASLNYGNITFGEDSAVSEFQMVRGVCAVNFGDAVIYNPNREVFMLYTYYNYSNSVYLARNYGNLSIYISHPNLLGGYGGSTNVLMCDYTTDYNAGRHKEYMNAGDLNIISLVPGTADAHHFNICCSNYINYGDVHVDGLNTPSTRFLLNMSRLTNYGDCLIENSKISTLDVYIIRTGGAWESRANDNVLNTGNTVIRNSDIKYMSFAGVRFDDFSPVSSMLSSVCHITNTGNITTDNIRIMPKGSSSEEPYVHIDNGIYSSYNLSRTYVWPMYADISSDISISNVTGNADLRITHIMTDMHKNNAVMTASGDVNINDCTFRSMAIGAVDKYYGHDTATIINKRNVCIRNTSIKVESMFSGGGMLPHEYGSTARLAGQYPNTYYFGSIDAEISGALLRVAGIGFCGYDRIDNAQNNNGVVLFNGGRIRVSSPDSISVSGIIDVIDKKCSNYSGTTYKSYDSDVFNAYYAGNIEIITADTTVATVTGISNHARKVYGCINNGRIDITGTGKAFVCAIANDVNDIMTDVNYGSVNIADTIDLQGSVFASMRSDASKLHYSLNFGEFNRVMIPDGHDGMYETIYIADMTGNKAIMPDGSHTYSTDASISNVSYTAPVVFDTFDTAIEGMGGTPLSTNVTRHITYDELTAPEFPIRSNNALATEYITALTRLEYNGDNGLEYVKSYESAGVLKRTINRYSGQGGYAVTMFDYSGLNVIGFTVDRLYCPDYDYNKTIPEWWDECYVGSKTFSEYFEDEIRQVYDGTSWIECADVEMQSVEKYATKDGESANITSKSVLIPFQSAIDGDDDGEYSKNIIVTIMDTYLVLNAFEDVYGRDIEFNTRFSGSYNGKFYAYSSPVYYQSSSDMISGIKAMLADEDAVLDGGVEASKITVRMADEGGITYCIPGYMSSEDGTHYNLIVFKEHSVSNAPCGWLTSLSYLTGAEYYSNKVTTDAFGRSASAYNAESRFVPYDNDKFTVEIGTQHTEAYGDLSYPIYNMTVPMWHTSDIFSNTGAFTASFKTQNIVRIREVIDDGYGSVYEYCKDMPADGVSTKDGIVVIKTGSMNIDEGFKRTSDNVSLSTLYNNNNPFYRGGDKVYTCYGYTDNNDEIILFSVNIHKNISIENYFRGYYGAERSERYSWWSRDVDDYAWTVTSNLDIGVLTGHDFENTAGGGSISSLSSSEYVDYSYGERIVNGYTNYPGSVTTRYRITSESGDEAVYSRTVKFNEFRTGYDWYYNNISNLNHDSASGVFLMQNDDDASWYLGPSPSNYTPNRDSNNSFISYGDGVINTYLNFYIDKIEKYEDGVYVGDLTPVSHIGLTESKSYVSQQDIFKDEALGVTFTKSLGKYYVIAKDKTVSRADFPDSTITYTVYMKADLPDGSTASLRENSFSVAKELSSECGLIRAKISKTIVATLISKSEMIDDIILDDSLDSLIIDSDGYIDYGECEEPVTHLYITDSVEPDCIASDFTYEITLASKLQKYVDNEWQTVFTATVDNPVYTGSYSFTTEQLGRGYKILYRILAQDYTENDAVKSTHVVYFDHTVYAVTRNKNVQIYIKDDDALTDALYDEIIDNNGNFAIQVKNMNGKDAKMQQTKFYRNDADKEPNYYKVSQGDFAIDVQVPEGYIAKCRIVGVSTEGWLQDNPIVKGKRIRLPYPNSQNIRIEVYLERDPLYPYWGKEVVLTTHHGKLSVNI